MLYVSPGWSSVFTVDLNVSSVWTSASALLHQSHLASFGRTASIVSALKMIMDWLVCVITIKLSTHSALICTTLAPPPTLFNPDSLNLARYSLSLPLPVLRVELG